VWPVHKLSRRVFKCFAAFKGRSASEATLRSKWIGSPDRPFELWNKRI